VTNQPTAQTVQTLQPIPNRIPVRIPDPLLPDLAAMYAAIGGERTLSFYSFVSQLVVERIVHYRSMRIKPSSLLDNFEEEGAAAEQRDDDRIHKRQLSAEDIQRAIHLRFTQGVSVAGIAIRLSCGISTVRRVCDEYERRQHNPSAVQPGPSRRHGNPEGW
jgi:hypothetical protein